MGKSSKEEALDWLYRLRSEIFVYMPKEWLIPMGNALDVAIDTVKREEMLEDWTKKCRKFEADYENRLKADMVAMLEELKEQLREMHEDFFETEHFDEAYGVSNSMDVIQEKIDKLKGKEDKIIERR